MESVESDSNLLVRADTRVYALPLLHVAEVMPRLPIESLNDTPAFVLGIAIVRGVPVPVVDLGLLSGSTPSGVHGRFVALRTEGRSVVLLVDAVLGVRARSGTLHPLPSLVGERNAAHIETLGTLDRALLIVLRSTRLVPDAVWQALSLREVTS